MELAEIALTAGRKQRESGNQTPVDVVTFIESKWGLNVSLHPVQRVIIKAHYGIPLDNKTPNVELRDWRGRPQKTLTEAEYLEKLFQEGRCNISAVVPGQERRELILSIGRRSGKCILGDSLVLTDQGIRRIEELGDPDGPEIQPLRVGVAQEGSVRSQSAYFYNGGIKDTRTLTTYCGYQLGGTDNHRIKVLSEQGLIEWRYLADLRVGDVVCIHRNTNLWAPGYVDCRPFHNDKGYRDLSFPDFLDEEWGRLLGYLVGDGLWNYKGRVEIAVEHPETWDTLKALYTKLLGSYSFVMDKRTQNTGSIKFGSVGMRAFLHDLGFRLGTDWDAKMVPWSILQSPASVVRAFLRGLFEADGGIENKGKVVSFCSASRRLVREVQVLLLNLGIVSRIKPRYIKGKVYWLLFVRGLRSRKLFAELVGFDSHKKMDPLLASFTETTREGGDTESIPHQWLWLQKLLASIPKNWTGGWNRTLLREVLGSSIKPGGRTDITYARLVKALPVATSLGADPEAIQHFVGLQEADYFFDPVTHIEEGRNPVYDLNVPKGESFVANGMTNHNTFLCACIAAYEIYKLILKECPQDYYGLLRTNTIGIISVATDKDQAGLLYTEASGHFATCALFKPYTANNTQSYAKFQTPHDIEKFGRYTENPAAKATLKMSFRSCIAKGLRGAGNIVAILDELAHFNDAGQSDALNVYSSIKPSLATFSPKDPNNHLKAIGDVEGRMISISSPLGKQGHFYHLFQTALKGGEATKGMLAIQAPTWEVNPTVPFDFLETQYALDPVVFFTEYGAQFLDATRGWLDERDLLQCISSEARPQTKAPPKRPHFMGIDLALAGDYTAISIGHLEADGHIVVDLMERIRAGEGAYAEQERLDFDGVADWVLGFTRKFYIVKGVFDQHAGIPFEQALHKRGLGCFEKQLFTKPIASEVFQNFKDMLWDKRTVLYDWPRRELDDGTVTAHCDYIAELLTLQATYHSKYITTVEAPNTKESHDDYSDALVRMVWLASQNLGRQKFISKGTGNNPIAPNTLAMDQARRKNRIQARLGGTHPSRQRQGPQRRNR